MRIQVREIQFEWFNQKLKIFLYTSGDVVSTLFNPPNALNIYPYFLTKRKGYFLDIGAHIGTASVFASYLFGKVLAFEPDPRSSSILKQNTQINNIKNIEVISKAVSDYCGVSYFHIENTLNAGRSSLLEIPNSTEKIEIEVVTLDSVLETSNLDVSYIKVDVEGIEINVLKGIEETISHQPVKPVIQLEFMPSRWHHTKNSFYWFLEFISDNNYVPFMTTQGLICPIDKRVLIGIFDSWKNLTYDSWFDLYLVPEALSSEGNILGAYNDARYLLQYGAQQVQCSSYQPEENSNSLMF